MDVEAHLFTETSEVSTFEVVHQSTRYILVDTPGFDDTDRPDREITDVILNWLKDSFDAGTNLNGVVYLHRIIDPRMTGTALDNTRMFRQLVGEPAFKNVILATTFWEMVPEDVASKREKELRSNRDFWGAMVSKGSRMTRLMNDKKSGLEILEQISRKKIVLEAQDEMNIQGKSIHDTAAAQELSRQHEEMVKALEKKKAEEVKRLAEEMKRREMEQAERLRRLKEQAEKKLQEARDAEIASQEMERIQAQKYKDEQRRLQMELEKQERRRQRELEEQERRRQRELEEEERRRQRKLEEQKRQLQIELEEERRRQREAEALAEQLQEEKERQAARWWEIIQEEERRRQRELEEQQRQLQIELEEEERRRQREAEALAKQLQEEKERQAARRREILQEFQRSYRCIGYKPEWRCDNCGRDPTRTTYYYHCCFCDNDKYFHCGYCGNDCGEASHPYMVQRLSPEDSCVMM
ncbi:hypothetical protein V8C35DRAFT_332760 [Trichoderma chlorosporum]